MSRVNRWCLAAALLVSLSGLAQVPRVLASYRPALGRPFAYRLLLNGTVEMRAGDLLGTAHFAATVDIEQRWHGVNEQLLTGTLTVRGGTLRVFSAVGEQVQQVGSLTLTLSATPLGELVEVRGGARSLEELTAELDLLATALSSLLVPFPAAGVRVGDAWQAAHRLGAQPALVTVQCVDAEPYRSVLKLRLRSTLPLDFLVDPQLRAIWQFTARYQTESEVLFSVAEGRTLSATGTVRLEASWRIPLVLPSEPPAQGAAAPETAPPSGEPPSNQQGASAPPSTPAEGQNPSPPSAPSAVPCQLRVDAKFDLLSAR